MSHDPRSHPSGGGTTTVGRDREASRGEVEAPSAPPHVGSPELTRALAEVRGQAQFLLYLADQIEDALFQLSQESDPGHGAFLCRILTMYSAQLENKHQGLGERIAETCQEVYVTVREHDVL